jgi:DNA-binding NarL/FixJ family response regulator
VSADDRIAVLVGPTEPRIDRLRLLLQQAGFTLFDAPDAVSALDRVWATRCDIVIVNHPVGGLDPADLIATVRHTLSPSRNTGLVLVVPGDRYDDAVSFIGRGANRVVSKDGPPDGLLNSVGDLIDTSPRQPVRAVVQVNSTQGEQPSRALMRTLDLSLSGMLIQGENELAVGDQFAFELHLPGVASAIVGSATVVRHTDRDRETVTGVGATFASFVGDGRTSLADFLTKNGN